MEKDGVPVGMTTRISPGRGGHIFSLNTIYLQYLPIGQLCLYQNIVGVMENKAGRGHGEAKRPFGRLYPFDDEVDVEHKVVLIALARADKGNAVNPVIVP